MQMCSTQEKSFEEKKAGRRPPLSQGGKEKRGVRKGGKNGRESLSKVLSVATKKKKAIKIKSGATNREKNGEKGG